jgi:hypothetical protein
MEPETIDIITKAFYLYINSFYLHNRYYFQHTKPERSNEFNFKRIAIRLFESFSLRRSSYTFFHTHNYIYAWFHIELFKSRH